MRTMQRRTWLQTSFKLCSALPLTRHLAFGQTASAFRPADMMILGQIASIVLPSELGESGVQATVKAFESYVRGYRAGADTDHGYGFTHVVPKPPSPGETYADQLQLFQTPVTRDAITQSLRQSQVKELPRIPEGKNLVADFMSFYFRSSEANDLCYLAHIGRDQCIGLASAEQPPKPLRRSA